MPCYSNILSQSNKFCSHSHLRCLSVRVHSCESWMLSKMWILWSNAFTQGLHWRGTKCSKVFSVTMSRRKYRIFGGSLHSSVGKIVPPQITWAKKWTNLAKPPTTDEEVPFRRLLSFWASRREHASKLGGRTWIFSRSPHAVSVSVVGRQAEAVADFRPPLVPRLLAEKQKQPSRYNTAVFPIPP